VSAASFCVVSFDGSARGGIDVRGSSAISFASIVGIETRSPGGLSATITLASVTFSFDECGATATFDSGLDGELALAPLGAGDAFDSLAGALRAAASAFAVTAGAGVIGFAFETGAAAFIGSVRPRRGEPLVEGKGVAFATEPVGAIGREPGAGGETFDGVGRCGDGPGFAADATFPKIGVAGAAGFDAALFVAAGPVGAAEVVDAGAVEGGSFAVVFAAGFSGSDGSPIHSS
jgi:hypothetical protein